MDQVGGEELPTAVCAEVEVETTVPKTREVEEKKDEVVVELATTGSATTVETQDSGIIVKDFTDGRKVAALERCFAAEKTLKG